MFKKTFLSFVVAAALVAGLSERANAVIMNPAPGTLNDDNGSSLFIPTGPSISITSIYDITMLLPLDWYSVFGFYYGSDPSNKIVIFGSEDTRSIPQSAVIDFGSGTVYDMDDGGSVQSSFLVQSNGRIGFFQYFFNSEPAPFTLLENSEAYLNPGALKAFAALQFVVDPNTYLVGFEEPVSSTLLSYNIVSGINPVPEPSTFLLLGAGLSAIGLYRRKRAS